MNIMKIFALILGIFATTAAFADGEVTVLCYHTFLGKEKLYTDFSPEEFDAQMETIANLGYRFVSMEEIRRGTVTGSKNILITIDDGNHSIRTIYDSVFVKRGIRPVLFLYPAIILGKVKYALRQDDLLRYKALGASFGGHGYNHLFVNDKLHQSDPRAFDREIFLSKKRNEEILGTPVTAYAYPFGVFSEITKTTLKRAGYDMGFSLRRSTLKVPLSRNEDMFDLPRWMVTRTSWHEIHRRLRSGTTAVVRTESDMKKSTGKAARGKSKKSAYVE
jgi:peptidoglycan/xylan/chitin deacetylase (PgdA/CDA1 family)